MWFGITINSFMDPKTTGEKYQSSTNPNFVLTFKFSWVTDDETIFLFSTSNNTTIELDSATLSKYYVLWVDPYAVQKKSAMDNGYVWKDEPPSAVPINVVDY